MMFVQMARTCHPGEAAKPRPASEGHGDEGKRCTVVVKHWRRSPGEPVLTPAVEGVGPLA
jgi:hypothetical protein